jgi:signal transduction histidine kinase
MQAIDEVGGLFREFASTQERAIEARAASERMRGLFLASMSHDLKAPLNAILGFSELASRNPLSEPQRESLAIIEQRGRELLHLIETILDAARTEAGELRVSLDLVPIADVIAVAMASSRELVFGQPVVLESQLQPGMPRVMVDPTRFAQALTLVVLTGVHLAVQGIVRVRATMAASGDRLRIDVDIPGSNSSEEPASLFDAFHNLEAARRHGSLGLGLSLARSIIELHQGKIEVQATMQSATEFHIWLPVVERGSGLVLPDSSSP